MKLSVITTTWNTAPWVDACLDSICSSTHTDLEIIVVDDGSTDGTAEKAAKWADRDSRVVFEALDLHKGRNAALKAAHGLATGQALSWVDSDDLVEPAGFERCLELLDDEHRVVTTWRRMIDENGADLGRDLRMNGPAVQKRRHFWHHLRVFTADLFHEAGGVGDMPAAIDTDMNLRFSLRTKAAAVYEIMYSQRYRPGRMTPSALQAQCARRARHEHALRKIDLALNTGAGTA